MSIFSFWKKDEGNKQDRQEPIASPPPPVTEPTRPMEWNTKFDDVLTCGRVQLSYWPNYSNPYQDMFYGRNAPLFASEPETIFDAIARLKCGTSDHVCFHVHWLNFLFKSKNMDKVLHGINEFISACEEFRAAGGTILWTVHNLQEHELVDGKIEASLRRSLSELASAIFVHGPAAHRDVISELPGIESKIHIITHGSYIGFYADQVSPVEAKTRLGNSADETTFQSLGWVRKYKGLTLLCNAMDELNNVSVAAKLVIAGKVRDLDQEYFENVFEKKKQIDFYEGWVHDDDIQNYMNASDFMVLPYRASLTSGAAMLAFSFSIPIIAPAIGSFPELIEDGKNGFLYDPDYPDGLQKALRRACSTTQHERAKMRVSAYETASAHNWSTARFQFFSVIDQLLRVA